MGDPEPESAGGTTVPMVVGLRIHGPAAAEAVLSQSSLAFEVIEVAWSSGPPGTIVAQTPAPGTWLPSGSIVTLTVSSAEVSP